MKSQKSYSRLELEAELGKTTRGGGRKPLIAPGSEDEMQAAFFNWIFLHEDRFPDLKMVFAVPNATFGKMQGARFKLTGKRAGVPDICIPIFSLISDNITDRLTPSLWIEFKLKGRTTSPEQKLFIQRLRDKGHEVQIHFSWITAVNALIGYLHLPIELLDT